ncbi:hypothetical protein [Flavivirga sp. 57AJ16]|uniref:hypothetical protein n=1 Tax=Flavivirga sp. 57AJ16 TaxID=3025307 RepID=UPI0023666684|nr:hypothetical protein [Flavivirga sp. 57AJ16]MDD7888255.1 hypothetical protein [Flavivirga sp. 57AJ16]
MSTKKLYVSLLACIIGSIGFISLLFAFTHKELERDMSFRRGFLYDTPKKTHELDLEYNGYYIAGAAKGQIYLGNTQSPLYLTVVDTALQNKQQIHFTIDRDSLPFRSPKVRVIPPHFFLMDGTVPYILRGCTNDWKAYSVMEDPPYFNSVQVMDSVTLAIRTVSNKTNEFALGTVSIADSTKTTLSYELLQKQVDGIFDVDGTLQYNEQRKQLVYTYRYRNQYIVANDSLQLQLLGKTIDTISQAQIKVGTIVSKKQKKMAAPALMVNRYCASSGNYLFVNSNLLGNKEPLVLWQKSAVIDVYDMVENRYEFSFYVEDIGKHKLKTFHVLHDTFIGLIGNHIVTYQLGDRFKKRQPLVMTAQNSNTKIQDKKLNSNIQKKQLLEYQ